MLIQTSIDELIFFNYVFLSKSMLIKTSIDELTFFNYVFLFAVK